MNLKQKLENFTENYFNVDELVEIYYLNDDKMNEAEAINYWQEVKQEIENF